MSNQLRWCQFASDTPSSCDVDLLQLAVEGKGSFKWIVQRYRWAVEEGDVAEEYEADENGKSFATFIASGFENKETVCKL